MNTEEYFQIVAKENPLDFFSKHICPYLVGTQWDIIRKCALLMGVTTDRPNLRMRLHILLCGGPGTGKSEFLSWWQQKMNGVLVNSELTSKTGLVGDARGKTIHPGLLARSHGSVLLVDELDKMSVEDQNGLLQAMEGGEYVITKGKNRQVFSAEIRVIATCNNIQKIQQPLVDRFDFPFKVARVSRIARAEYVSDIIDSFMGKDAKDYSLVVKAYLEWAQNARTRIDPVDEPAIKKAIKDYILNTDANIEGVSYRSLEFSILRIAYALALLERSKISERHIMYAIDLKDTILKNFMGSIE
ncbi:MAG: AAA family ATPase [Candidatus Thermoplasmatota archaeon]|nr:AAA family ATPase [Candidatus Thermoplasmatota archaeon]MBU1940634.1 AAA family ATPase [Candidatus Thermoplasmatota archaeon]